MQCGNLDQILEQKEDINGKLMKCGKDPGYF